ncbi:MAG: SUMF1/EgtB/PvdO family nonheme iron enzyme [Polyangiaceae bacterium]
MAGSNPGSVRGAALDAAGAATAEPDAEALAAAGARAELAVEGLELALGAPAGDPSHATAPTSNDPKSDPMSHDPKSDRRRERDRRMVGRFYLVLGFEREALAITLAVIALACSERHPTPQETPKERGSVSAASASASSSPSSVELTAAPSATSPLPAPSCPRDMVLIPEATFVFGASTRQAVERGSPTRVPAHCLDRTEVSTDAYVACLQARHCAEPLTGGSCSFKREGAGRHPINCVGLEDARSYCAWVEKRLPTEAEWESAASGGTRTYPWGEDPPGKGVCWDGAENALGYGKRHDSCDVGSFDGDATPEGVLDMGGNVSEWTELQAPTVRGDPDQAAARRGGGWGTKHSAFLLRTTSRRVGGFDRYKSGIFTGFRCAADVRSPQ